MSPALPRDITLQDVTPGSVVEGWGWVAGCVDMTVWLARTAPWTDPSWAEATGILKVVCRVGWLFGQDNGFRSLEGQILLLWRYLRVRV
jgi:hypothetical protein